MRAPLPRGGHTPDEALTAFQAEHDHSITEIYEHLAIIDILAQRAAKQLRRRFDAFADSA